MQLPLEVYKKGDKVEVFDYDTQSWLPATVEFCETKVFFEPPWYVDKKYLVVRLVVDGELLFVQNLNLAKLLNVTKIFTSDVFLKASACKTGF